MNVSTRLNGFFHQITLWFFLKRISNSQKSNPLYIINGIAYRGEEAQAELIKITSDKIESIKVLKNKEAVARFGDEGENGAIVIDLTKI